MSDINLGFIGLGWWGARLAEAATETEGVNVAACHARSADSRQQFASKFGAKPVSDFKEMLDDEGIDGVVVATPHTTHADLVTQAITAGKHVFVEKPMTVTVGSAKQVLSAATSGDVVVQVGHNRRKQTALRTIKRMIVDGDLGEVQSVEANISGPTAYGWSEEGWRLSRDELPGGGLTVMGVHMIDNFHYLVGLPDQIVAMSHRQLALSPVEETTSSLLRFGTGPIGYLSTSVTIPRVNAIGVLGSDASVWSADDGDRMFFQSRSERSRVELDVEPNDPLVVEIGEFADCIRTGATPETGAQEGYEAVVTMMAIVDSAESGLPVALDWIEP